MESKYADVNGIRIRWEEKGEGQPVVFIHGIPTCPRLWRHVIPSVHEARTLAWEMVGYGASIKEGNSRDISVAQQADYLVKWMQTIDLERAVFVGHDLGGGVAQIVAVKYPERVQGLVLMNSIAYDSWPIPSVKAMQAMGALVSRLPNTLFYRIFNMFLHQGHDNRKRAEESIAEHWQHYESLGGAAAFIRQTRSLNVQDTLAIADQLPNLKIPVQLVWGAADQFQKIGYGYRLAYDLHAPLDRIEHGKHFVPEDHPDRVAAAVNRLLKQVEHPE